jgi:hypothetical protein
VGSGGAKDIDSIRTVRSTTGSGAGAGSSTFLDLGGIISRSRHPPVAVANVVHNACVGKNRADAQPQKKAKTLGIAFPTGLVVRADDVTP